MLPLIYPFLSTHDAPAWSPGRVVSHADKIVISAFFASSFVRNNISCLHFTTNENTADRQISLFGEGLARTNPNTTWIIIYITRSITDGYKLLFSTTCANSPRGILWKVHFQSRCEHITIRIFGESLYTHRWCPNVTQKRKRLYIWLPLLWTKISQIYKFVLQNKETSMQLVHSLVSPLLWTNPYMQPLCHLGWDIHYFERKS